MKLRTSFCGLIIVILLGACSGGSSTVQPPAVPVATPTPLPHLYVADDEPGGGLGQYTLPLSMSSASNFVLPLTQVESVAPYPNGGMLVGQANGEISLYGGALSPTSLVAAQFSNGANNGVVGLVANSAGDVFAATGNASVNVFTHPLNDASMPSSTLTVPGSSLSGIALDNSGNLIVTDERTGFVSALDVWTPPYTGAPAVVTQTVGALYRGVAVHGSQAAVAGPIFPSSAGVIDIYNLPITSSSAPAFSITSGISIPDGVAFDKSGNLYVTNLYTRTVTVYAQPLSAASTPLVTMPMGSTSTPLGITIAP